MSNLFDHINQQRNAVAERIEKSFCNDIEKARSGTYADTAENRKLNRVGQQYGSKKQVGQSDETGEKRDSSQGEPDSNYANHASSTDTEVLKRVVDSDKADPKLKAAAEAELKKRGADVAEKKTEALGAERSKKSLLKTSAGKKQASEELLSQWDSYVEGGDVSAEDIKETIESNGLTREDVKKHWAKTFKEADLHPEEIEQELDNLFELVGQENPDKDIDPEWEPTSEDKENKATGKELRKLTEALEVFDDYAMGEADREAVAEKLNATGWDVDEFKKKATYQLMIANNLSRDEVNNQIENMFDIADFKEGGGGEKTKNPKGRTASWAKLSEDDSDAKNEQEEREKQLAAYNEFMEKQAEEYKRKNPNVAKFISADDW